MKTSEILTTGLLEKEYAQNRMSCKQIAKKYNIRNEGSVRHLLLKYNITRSRIYDSDSILTKEFLEEHYVRLGKTMTEIGIEVGLKGRTAVARCLRLHSIKKRKCSDYSDRISKGKRKNGWTGYEELSGKYMYTLLYGAFKRKLDFNISAEYLWNLFLRQNKKCALSGEDIIFAKRTTKEAMLLQTASLDRIDSSKGYTKDNVQWVHKKLQKMKWDMPNEEFIEWCCKVKIYKENQ